VFNCNIEPNHKQISPVPRYLINPKTLSLKKEAGCLEMMKEISYRKANQTYLKFLRLVILNLFQDLTLWIKRDAEPSSA
jgi:hypothetical protein